MIGALVEAKAAGVPFEAAWQLAMQAHPPMLRKMDRGPVQPSLLDDETDMVTFLRLCCEDAWFGRRPVLRHLRHALELVVADETRAAGDRNIVTRTGRLVA